MKIKSKLIISNLLVFGLLLSGLAYAVYSQTRHSEMTAMDLKLETCAAKIITEFEDEWDEEHFPEWDKVLLIAAEGLDDVHRSFRRLDDSLLFGTASISAPNAAERTTLRSRQVVRGITNHGGADFRRCVFAAPGDEEVEFSLTLISPLAPIYARLDRLAILLGLAVMFALFLGSVAVYAVTHLALRPLTLMIGTAESISDRQLDHRIGVGTGKDEVSQLAAALNGMMDRLETAFKSQRQFVADASHELRTPLTVIIAELEHLQRRVADEKLNNRDFDTPLRELDRLTRLIELLLTLARIDAKKLTLKKQSVRLDELLLEAVRFLRPDSMRRHVSIIVEQINPVEIAADPVRLNSVVVNLLENALKYSAPHSSVTVRLLPARDGRARLEIADSGPGVAPEERAKIFDRFYRSAHARSISEGSGLGLAIARELIELHEGRITVEADPGGGAIFAVELPLV